MSATRPRTPSKTRAAPTGEGAKPWKLHFYFTMVVGLLLIGVPIAFRWASVRSSFLLLMSDTSLASDRAVAVSGDGRALYAASNPVLHSGVVVHVHRRRGAADNPVFHSLCGHLPGGLAIAGVFACMMFAALAGRRRRRWWPSGRSSSPRCGRRAIPRNSPPV